MLAPLPVPELGPDPDQEQEPEQSEPEPESAPVESPALGAEVFHQIMQATVVLEAPGLAPLAAPVPAPAPAATPVAARPAGPLLPRPSSGLAKRSQPVGKTPGAKNSRLASMLADGRQRPRPQKSARGVVSSPPPAKSPAYLEDVSSPAKPAGPSPYVDDWALPHGSVLG